MFIQFDDYLDTAGKLIPDSLPTLDHVWSPSPGEATVLGEATVSGEATVTGEAIVPGEAIDPGEAPPSESPLPRDCSALIASLPASKAVEWCQPPVSIANARLTAQHSLDTFKFRPGKSWSHLDMPILQESWSCVRSVYLALNAFVTRDLWDVDLVSKLDPCMLSAKRAATASSSASSNRWDNWTDNTSMSNPAFSSALPQTSSHSRSPPANYHAFAARVNRHTISDPYAPTWTQAMNDPNQTKWFKAMCSLSSPR